MPLINVDRLSMALSPTYCIQVVHGPAIQRTSDTNIEGAGGVRIVRARVAVFKILLKFFKILSVIITKVLK